MLDGRTATRGITVALAGLLALAGCGGSSSGGGGGSGSSASTTWVHHWNEIAIDASGLDHTPVAPGETRVFGEQLGPGRAARAMAIVHIAVFDAMNAIEGGYESYTGIPRVQGKASMEAAIAEAAYETLGALFPSQEAAFHGELEDELATIPDSQAKSRGIDVGHRAAAAILGLRADDGSQHPEPHYGVD